MKDMDKNVEVKIKDPMTGEPIEIPGEAICAVVIHPENYGDGNVNATVITGQATPKEIVSAMGDLMFAAAEATAHVTGRSIPDSMIMIVDQALKSRNKDKDVIRNMYIRDERNLGE